MCMRPGFRITRYDIPRRYRTVERPCRDLRNGLYLAFSKSFSSKVHTGKHCAVLFDKHKNVVTTIVNCHRADGIGTIHAEEGLIGEILEDDPAFDFSECIIMVVRGNKLGVFSNSAPCDKCLEIMTRCGVGQIIFTTRQNELCTIV